MACCPTRMPGVITINGGIMNPTTLDLGWGLFVELKRLGILGRDCWLPK